MPRFFINNQQISDGIVSIIGDDAHHIARALRMAVGENILVCDELGKEYDCEIFEFIDDREVRAKVFAYFEDKTGNFLDLFLK